ncbi:hypothetical protein INT47_008661 [Mucor saturninus]|uniref:Uncharacterized protein n=1 Tax=Mucor saturninus TaxID=64648 RepID=A0A8H7QJN4_9FUNG|nr:hypothetical protein INT47_008661 [Mucor saturninus]
MEEVYDYSQHRYCIIIDLGYDRITSRAMDIKGSLMGYTWIEKEYIASLLYDTTTRNIIARGDKVDEANENPKGLQEGVIYVRNTLSELADIYLKSKQQSFDNTALYALLYEEAIDLLQRILYDYKQELIGVNMDFFYSLNLPTSWDYKIREELFLSLFVKAGLLHENDGPDYQGTYSVDLKLVSAQYPAFRLEQRKLVPQLLKQAHFVVPFGLKEIRLSLLACVIKHCDTTLSSESIDDMLEKLSQKYNGFERFYFRELKELYISAELHENRLIFKLFEYDDRQIPTQELLDYRMEEFNMRRNPIILPKEEPKSCLKPVIFINIGKLTP